MQQTELDASHMARALELAARGAGLVEPNPMVGCVIVSGDEVVGEGFHQRFGGPHAEVAALASAGVRATGGTAYVTLEPCNHQGKTPPCAPALIRAGLRRVVIAQRDPFAKVAGRGIAELEQAGLDVEVGLLEAEARELNAPYLKLVTRAQPWIIAKWAMTLDGKLATKTGDSRWISGEASRAIVHQLRGRVDGIMIGRGTAEADDPLLTARPAGARVAARIILDSEARLKLSSQLVRTARDVPVIVAVSEQVPPERREKLVAAGCEVLACSGATHAERLSFLLSALGQRQLTNILVEGGAELLGQLFDADQIDEVHAFIAPKIIGGQSAPSPLGGEGIDLMARAKSLVTPTIAQLGPDVHIHGRLAR